MTTDDAPTLVAIVQCGKAKADVDGPVPARELYTSAYFAEKRAWCDRFADRWRVLSAEHGLLDPDDEVARYNTHLSDLDADERLDWEDGVTWGVKHVVRKEDADALVVLAGRDYVAALEEAIEGIHYYGDTTVYDPFARTDGMPEQREWLRAAVEADDPLLDDDHAVAPCDRCVTPTVYERMGRALCPDCHEAEGHGDPRDPDADQATLADAAAGPGGDRRG